MNCKALRTLLVAAGALPVATGALLAVPAAAQTRDPMSANASALAPAGDTVSQVAFAYADRNEDGLVSWEEYRNRAMRVFGHADADSDGVLEIAELKTLDGAAAAAPKADVDLATFNAALRKQFDSGDKNGDGVLTPAEWQDVVRPSKLF